MSFPFVTVKRKPPDRSGGWVLRTAYEKRRDAFGIRLDMTSPPSQRLRGDTHTAVSRMPLVKRFLSPRPKIDPFLHYGDAGRAAREKCRQSGNNFNVLRRVDLVHLYFGRNKSIGNLYSRDEAEPDRKIIPPSRRICDSRKTSEKYASSGMRLSCLISRLAESKGQPSRTPLCRQCRIG